MIHEGTFLRLSFPRMFPGCNIITLKEKKNTPTEKYIATSQHPMRYTKDTCDDNTEHLTKLHIYKSCDRDVKTHSRKGGKKDLDVYCK